MLRKSNSSSSSSGGAGGLGTKHVQDLPQHKANPHPKSLSPRSTKAWTMGRSTRNPNPLSTMGLSSRLMGAPGVDADYVMQLVNDVRWFADVLLNLKDAFQEKGLQDLVKERLAELIRVLKTVISKHQTLNSVDILGAAGMVIAKVKGINFKEVNPENKQAKFGEIHTSIDILAFTFVEVKYTNPALGYCICTSSVSSADITEPELSRSREEEVDLTLLKNDSGVESALLYAKAWSKYIKDLLGWMEKRAAMDIDYAKSYTKMAETAKTLASQQDYMPFSDVYVSTFKRDIDYNQLLIHTAVALQTNKFMQPLLARKNELDKLRKDMKEQWQREQKKMQEADTTLRKARALNTQRREEYQRAHSSKNRSMEEQPIAGNKQMEKKRKLEEEALQKAEEAQDQYQSCVADTDVRKMDLANVKRTILTQIREMVFQCDLTLKAVTVNWFQMQQAQTLALPDHFQALSESTKLYEPGGCYAKFVQNLPRNLPVEHLRSHSSSDFSRFVLSKKSQGSAYSSHGNLSQASATSCDVPSGDDVDRPAKIGERRSNSSVDITALRSQGPLRAWASSSQGSQGGMCSDSESAGGSSESRSMDSPTASPGDFKRRLPRTPSTGTMSSADDLDEREPLSPLDNGLTEMVIETASSPGPFRNTQLSKAAQTHKLRKLRAPSKCRECDSLVVFHGAECEECTLACHKKCLETLAIQCGHKKLQGRLQLFGIDFAQAAKNSPDGIPFIIKKCTSEIESRALNIKGIYRVNGAKLRVEKLCQAFENGKDLVELSDLSPHDISNVLKLYLRQLPEPLITFRFYNNFIGLAKECQRVVVEEAVKHQGTQTKEKTSPSIQMSTVLSKIRELLHQLPAANYRTLRHIIAHLNRVTEQAEENKMTASNLGIIFGPTMVKPRQIDAEVSLSSLVDYPYQVLMVEQLVRHFHTIFDDGSNMATSGHASPRLTPQEKVQQLGRHSASLTDIKEVRRDFKSKGTLFKATSEVRPGRDTTEPSTSEKLNGVQAPGAEGQRSTSNIPTIDTEPKVQMRNQRGRQCSRPISMPLERLPAPAQISERNNRNASDKADGGFPQRETETIQEMPEPERARQTGSSRISTYYITPFIDTQAMQRRTWDKKYKHYHVTPRTAMIVANLPPVNAGLQPVKATVPAFPAVTTTPVVPTTKDESGNSPKLPLTLRPPRTLHPSPETFYRPPLSSNSKAWSLPTRTTTTATTSPPSPTTLLRSLSPTNPTQALHQTQDSTDSAIDPGVLTSTTISPSQSPPPSSPDDLSPTEVKPRLRSRPLQDHEQREAHFV
uniref:Rho GTPase-activating protein 29 n=1 Tax=Nothobranchius furzeri TaxID=105023 RepID=A0A8C6PAG3_NOTFU